ncbi:hypothetical protein LCGC14_1290780 [marine sediment metagenome]|uniref:AP2/ERF domain-containing protein n=1 Tax=marine sediment metagenome TaxID=412755 RepID=A0A0F9KU86_9ZZZZ
MIGKKIGRLLVIREAVRTKGGRRKWLCKCNCGNLVSVMDQHLKNLNTQSCGCLHRELLSRATVHGYRRRNSKLTPEYVSWQKAKSRCHNVNDKSYKYYGARGIMMCKEWRDSFAQFFKDMGQRPEGYSIERIDNEGNYEASNCKWATRKEQNSNQRKRIKGLRRLKGKSK